MIKILGRLQSQDEDVLRLLLLGQILNAQIEFLAVLQYKIRNDKNAFKMARFFWRFL